MKKECNVKRLWNRMLPSTRGKVIGLIIADDEFEVTDPVYVKQHWIWGEKTPEKYKNRVIEIFQNALIQQEEQTKELIK